ncbi:unnamed protein product, partial [Durusdinium trenchii]
TARQPKRRRQPLPHCGGFVPPRGSQDIWKFPRISKPDFRSGEQPAMSCWMSIWRSVVVT